MVLQEFDGSSFYSSVFKTLAKSLVKEINQKVFIENQSALNEDALKLVICWKNNQTHFLLHLSYLRCFITPSLKSISCLNITLVQLARIITIYNYLNTQHRALKSLIDVFPFFLQILKSKLIIKINSTQINFFFRQTKLKVYPHSSRIQNS